MRAVEIAQILATVAGTVVTILSVRGKKLINRLRKAGADDAATAVELPVDGGLAGWLLVRLKRRRIVRETSDGKVYLDEAAIRARRRLVLSIVLPLTLAAIALIIFLHQD